MPKAIFTADAEQDLGHIVDYIARDSMLAALSWLEEMRAICTLIATQPDVGQRVQTTASAWLRRHVVGNYLIYYEPVETGVSIVRVVHGAREQERLI